MKRFVIITKDNRYITKKGSFVSRCDDIQKAERFSTYAEADALVDRAIEDMGLSQLRVIMLSPSEV